MDLNAAADAIRQLATRYEAMVVAADVLSKIGNLDNAVKEATARAAAANADADKAGAERDKLLQAVADAKTAVEVEYREQRAKQEAVLADLTAEGARVVQFAKDAAAKERADVQAEIDAIRQTQQETAERHAAALREARGDLADLNAEIDAKTAALADLEGKLAAAREAMGKLLAA